MWPTVTDRVAWSVGRSVSPAEIAEPIWMLFGLWAQGIMHQSDGVQISPCKGAILGERTCLIIVCHELCQSTKWKFVLRIESIKQRQRNEGITSYK